MTAGSPVTNPLRKNHSWSQRRRFKIARKNMFQGFFFSSGDDDDFLSFFPRVWPLRKSWSCAASLSLVSSAVGKSTSRWAVRRCLAIVGPPSVRQSVRRFHCRREIYLDRRTFGWKPTDGQKTPARFISLSLVVHLFRLLFKLLHFFALCVVKQMDRQTYIPSSL